MNEILEKMRKEDRLLSESAVMKAVQKALIEMGYEPLGDEVQKVFEAIDNVKELAEEHNGGWIPCSERLPDKLEPVNVTWVNRKPEPYYAHIKDIPFVATAFYHNGKWWWYSCVCEDYLSEYGESECDAVDKDIDIIAWQPLPPTFKPKGE